MRDLLNNLKVVNLLHPIVVNNDTEGTPVTALLNRDGYEAAAVIAQIGISGDTLSGSVYLTVKAQESDDGSTWAAITDDTKLIRGSGSAAPDSNGIVATIDDAAEDDVMLCVGYVGDKQYFRLTLDLTGTHTNGIPCSMIGLLGAANQLPFANT